MLALSMSNSRTPCAGRCNAQTDHCLHSHNPPRTRQPHQTGTLLVHRIRSAPSCRSGSIPPSRRRNRRNRRHCQTPELYHSRTTPSSLLQHVPPLRQIQITLFDRIKYIIEIFIFQFYNIFNGQIYKK